MVDASEQEILINNSSDITVIPTPTSTPAPFTNPIITPVSEPAIEPKPAEQVTKNKPVEESLEQVKKPLWSKILSIFCK